MKRLAAIGLVTALLGIALAGDARAASNPSPGAGIGSAEALGSSACDPATKRIKVPFQYAPPCVRPWRNGADNGGPTTRGVTARSIKVVAVGGGVVDRASDRKPVEQMWADEVSLFEHTFQTWGRTIDLEFKDFGAQVTPDETTQRAMATEIITEQPFAVIAMGGGTVFNQVLAAAKILVVTAGGVSVTESQALAPYLWVASEPAPADVMLGLSAQYIADVLQGRPAAHAGDQSMRKTKRSFGLIYGDSADAKYIDAAFQRSGVKLAAKVTYRSANFEEQAQTLIAKLKNAGVTTVVNGTDITTNGALLGAATNQDYFPEWFITGANGLDLSLFARNVDQKQWRNAFGIGAIPPAPGNNWMASLLDWYFGPQVPAWRGAQLTPANAPNTALSMQLIEGLFVGIHMAGPRLTPITFRNGMFAYPPSGGRACGCVTMVQTSYGRHGGLPGYDDYFGPDDVEQLWWDADSTGPDELAGIEGTGYYRYVDGAKRYTFGAFPKQEPNWFDPTGTVSPNDLETLPASDQPPDYPCVDCPSTASGSK